MPDIDVEYNADELEYWTTPNPDKLEPGTREKLEHWTKSTHNLQDFVLPGCDLSGINLAKTPAHPEGYNLQNADLYHANFSKAHLFAVDFRNATLRIGKEKRRVSGDLEIHIHPNGWKQHGHANDPNFSNVRFHVVYFQGGEIPGLLQIPLQETLATDPRFSFENIDLTAYPYSIPSGDFPLKAMHPDQKINWLESAGEERLRLKAERFAFAL